LTYIHADDVQEIPEWPTTRFPCYSLVNPSLDAAVRSVNENVEPFLPPDTSGSTQSRIGSQFNEAVVKNFVNPAQKSTLAVEDVRAFSKTLPKRLDDGMASDDDVDIRRHYNKPDFRLQPGSYTIILCIDNQEIHTRYVMN
jgi:hypothetical protein